MSSLRPGQSNFKRNISFNWPKWKLKERKKYKSKKARPQREKKCSLSSQISGGLIPPTDGTSKSVIRNAYLCLWPISRSSQFSFAFSFTVSNVFSNCFWSFLLKKKKEKDSGKIAWHSTNSLVLGIILGPNLVLTSCRILPDHSTSLCLSFIVSRLKTVWKPGLLSH